MIHGPVLKGLLIFISPLTFSLAYVLTAGLLSLPHQKAIIPGKFPTRIDHPVYGRRRLYGLCWTAVYYFTPIYFLFLTVPILKKLLFRLFGYRGQMDFTIYPDTWIRDLPLLNFGQGAYISNRATLGTNIIFRKGFILVGPVTIGDGVLIGHLAMLAPGVVVEKEAEVGVGVAVGLISRIGERAIVGPCAVIEHGAVIEANSRFAGGWFGGGAVLGQGMVLTPGTVVPGQAVIKTRDDVAKYLSLSTRAPYVFETGPNLSTL
ncbi:MAG: hypothetical protein HQK58_04465 [Deltaproteobacteria bacterium]|nr:hypothetical protein [Deltaproteobacteria bacterium]